ncbi:MAG: extracellular solute-binding protein [Actinomycetota bacterium]
MTKVRRRRRPLLKIGSAITFIALAAGCVHPIQESTVRPRSGHLEVRAFQGGYGVDFYERAAKEYVQSHPGVTIDLKGDPRIWDQLRPRFIAGDPPALAFPGWGMDLYALIYENQALPLDDVLLTSPYGESSGTWRSTFIPEVLKLGEYNNQTYLLPYYLNLNGWWYNVGLFEENGWQPPTTYDQLLVLCEKIKAKGIAPITYQGKYPYYALQGFLLPWAISIGGPDAIRSLETLEPGAWRSEPFMKAAGMVDELRRKGYFQSGAGGMSHTEAQMEFLQGRAAMIPCGTWLESEMKKQLPDGFKMAFFLPPHVTGGKGDPTTLQVSVEPWMIASQGQNQALAIEFFKYLTSRKKAREFVLEKGSLTAIRDTDQDPLPATLRKPAEALRNAKFTWTTRYAQWYKPMEDASRSAMGSLLQGEISPEKFGELAEAGAEKVRKDPNIPKRSP